MSPRTRIRTIVVSTCVGSIALGAGIAAAAAGDLDSSFAGDGIAQANLTGNSAVADVAIQGDGKIVAAGNSDTSGTDLAALTRYTTVGALDTTSGFGAGTGVVQTQYGADPTTVLGVGVRSNGDIVTAGFKDEGSIDLGLIAEHDTDGSLHDGGAGFGGSDGFVQPSFNLLADGSGNRLNDMLLLPNGRAIAVGSMGIGGTSPSENFALFGVDEDGDPVSGFGNQAQPGEAVASVSGSVGSTGEDRANAIAVDPTGAGSFIVAGEVDPTTADGGANDDEDLAIVRFTVGGDVDAASGFGGGDGIVTADIGDSNDARDVAVQPDGKIVVAGDRDADGAGLDLDHFVMRFNANGTPDAGFGDGGDGNFVQSIVGPDNTGETLVRLPDGRLVVGGATVTTQDWVVARYTAAGLPDTSFDGDGSRAYDFSPDGAALHALGLQGDGKLIAGGSIASDFAVGRLAADPPPPVVNPPVITPTPIPTAAAAAPAKKKCKKGQKLRKGKCVKKRRKRQ
jgi:uncharacterized delta-60 repeat protein